MSLYVDMYVGMGMIVYTKGDYEASFSFLRSQPVSFESSCE